MRSSRGSGLAGLAAIALGLASLGGSIAAVGESAARASSAARDLGNALAARAPGTDQALRAQWLAVRGSRGSGYPTPGWSVREGQRRARKARNVRRNRRSHRG